MQSLLSSISSPKLPQIERHVIDSCVLPPKYQAFVPKAFEGYRMMLEKEEEVGKKKQLLERCTSLMVMLSKEEISQRGVSRNISKIFSAIQNKKNKHVEGFDEIRMLSSVLALKYNLKISDKASESEKKPEKIQRNSLKNSAAETSTQIVNTLKCIEDIDNISKYKKEIKLMASDIDIYHKNLINDLAPSDLVAKGNSDKLSIIFDNMSDFVKTQILSESDVKKRCGIIFYFVKIITELMKKKNYQAAGAFLAGLTHSSLFNLTHTWEEFEKKFSNAHKKLADYQSLFNPEHNFRNLRELEKDNKTGVLFYPYHKRDIEYHIGGKGLINEMDGRIDLEQFTLFTELFKKIQQYHYGVEVVYYTDIMDLIMNPRKRQNSDDFYALQAKLEPGSQHFIE